MPQFLFIVEIPSSKGISSSPGYPHEWIQFANDANTILSPVKTYTRYQQNVWSLPVENGLPVLLALSSTAVKYNLAYSVLLLEDIIDLSSQRLVSKS